MHKDKFGTEIKEGDYVIHANSARYVSLSVAKVAGNTPRMVKLVCPCSWGFKYKATTVRSENLVVINESLPEEQKWKLTECYNNYKNDLKLILLKKVNLKMIR